MSKKKVSVRLADDEVAVVGSIDQWRHLIMVYEAFANDPDDPADRLVWLEAADWIRYWLTQAKVEDDGWE